MSRSIMLKAAAAACVVTLIACGLLIFTRTVHIGISYADAERYTAGAATLDEAVNNLDISWIDGSVAIAYHAQNTVEIAETAPNGIPGDGQLRWWLDGDTLRIQYAKPGFVSLKSLNKALTVTLPEGAKLTSLAIDAASADVDVPELDADSTTVGLSSGSIALNQTGAAERVELTSTSGGIRATLADAKSVLVDTTSGSIEIEQTGSADSFALSSTSGDMRAALSTVGTLTASASSGAIHASFESAESVSVDTTSGDIAVVGGDARKVALGSTSGKIEVSLSAFDAIAIDSTSGDVIAALPPQPGYQAEIDTTSGRFDYSVALMRNGDSYSCGDGSASVRIDTTSGNILLESTEKK